MSNFRKGQVLVGRDAVYQDKDGSEAGYVMATETLSLPINYPLYKFEISIDFLGIVQLPEGDIVSEEIVVEFETVAGARLAF